MRGIILLGILGFLIFGCISYVTEETGEGPETIITTDQECPGCAVEEEEEEQSPAEEEPEEEEVPEEDQPETLTEEEARAIALNSSCMEDGNITDNYTYNDVTHTWWFETDIVKEGCMPACVVDEETKSAEINWRCTGLIIPENETGCVGPGETEYDIFKQDEVTYDGEPYADECTLATVVKDYYCKNNELKDISTECPSGYDCRDGRCKPMDYECTKTFGNDTTIRGHITVVKGINTISDEYDECVDEGTVKEWMCAEDGSGYYEEIYCGTGMKCQDEEGRCVRSHCVETDSGNDPEHFGRITFTDHDEMYSDVCIEDEKLRECYCYGEMVAFDDYRCEGECFGGECVPVSE